VLSGAPENTLAESESTLLRYMGVWEHLEVLRSTGVVAQRVWEDSILLPNQLTFCSGSYSSIMIIQACTKQINICYHNGPELHVCKIVDYICVNTSENVADILIQALSKDIHEKLTAAIGLWFWRSIYGSI